MCRVVGDAVCVLAFLGDLGFEEAEQCLSDGGFDALAYGQEDEENQDEQGGKDEEAVQIAAQQLSDKQGKAEQGEDKGENVGQSGSQPKQYGRGPFGGFAGKCFLFFVNHAGKGVDGVGFDFVFEVVEHGASSGLWGHSPKKYGKDTNYDIWM